MHPDKVDRYELKALTDLPNIGPSIAIDLQSIGIGRPQQLAGRCPFELYQALCDSSGIRHDPCVLDVFMSVTDFVDGGSPRPWWAYTAQRKLRYGKL